MMYVIQLQCSVFDVMVYVVHLQCTVDVIVNSD